MRIAVTGAFGYSGRYITRRLLNAGHEVITLTNSPTRPHPFGDRVTAYPLHFECPELLTDSLRGVDALINTYWVRFDHRLFRHDTAVENTRTLFGAARNAGVNRIVHVSITNPDLNSDLPYFRGKAVLESELKSLGASWCILRPTVLFGLEDVLINNIAWALRRLPVFGVFGAGDYRLQPIYVDDLAAEAARQAERDTCEVVNAIGPETFTYREMVATIRNALGLRRWIVSIPPTLGYWTCRALGRLVRDVVITREEIRGLMAERLFVDGPPLGATHFTDWVGRYGDQLGRRYSSELSRRVDRACDYRASSAAPG